jgi:hypothetical protein
MSHLHLASSHLLTESSPSTVNEDSPEDTPVTRLSDRSCELLRPAPARDTPPAHNEQPPRFALAKVLQLPSPIQDGPALSEGTILDPFTSSSQVGCFVRNDPRGKLSASAQEFVPATIRHTQTTETPQTQLVARGKFPATLCRSGKSQKMLWHLQLLCLSPTQKTQVRPSLRGHAPLSYLTWSVQ